MEVGSYIVMYINISSVTIIIKLQSRLTGHSENVNMSQNCNYFQHSSICHKCNSKTSISHDTYQVGKVLPYVVVEVAAYEVRQVPSVGEVESFQSEDGTLASVAYHSEDRLETLAAVHRPVSQTRMLLKLCLLLPG